MTLSHTHTTLQQPYPEVLLLACCSTVSVSFFLPPFQSPAQVETLPKQTANNDAKLFTFEGGLSVTNIRVIDLFLGNQQEEPYP